MTNEDFEYAAQTDPIMKHFRFGHLPVGLQNVSRRFGEVAMWMFKELPRNAERTVALRKLLEAKDAAVRSVID